MSVALEGAGSVCYYIKEARKQNKLVCEIKSCDARQMTMAVYKRIEKQASWISGLAVKAIRFGYEYWR